MAPRGRARGRFANYGQPADRFVESFIGSPPMSFGRSAFVATVGEVDVGVRPEDAQTRSANEDLRGPVRGEVLYVEDLGGGWFAGVRVGDAAAFVVGGTTKPPPDIGASLEFGVRPSGIFIFDRESEACVLHPGQAQRTESGLSMVANGG
jgi:ABC-type sugar transport system ATPase subunit